jgi:hypothetical protein
MKGKEVETMLNMFTLVGRLGSMSCDTIELKVQGLEKNANDEYPTYTLFIMVGANMLNQIKEYCHIGDLVGVKGKILDNNKLVGEKVTFLSSRKNND